MSPVLSKNPLFNALKLIMFLQAWPKKNEFEPGCAGGQCAELRRHKSLPAPLPSAFADTWGAFAAEPIVDEEGIIQQHKQQQRGCCRCRRHSQRDGNHHEFDGKTTKTAHFPPDTEKIGRRSDSRRRKPPPPFGLMPKRGWAKIVASRIVSSRASGFANKFARPSRDAPHVGTGLPVHQGPVDVQKWGWCWNGNYSNFTKIVIFL